MVLNKEREKRLRARTDLLTYASSIEIPGAPIRDDTYANEEDLTPVKANFGAHHLLWISLLQQVEDGKIKRLMGLLPPGSGKSTYSSIVFPTHFMGRFPNSMVIMTSYGDVLPRKFGRRARSIVQQPVYDRIFDTKLSEESSAADEWALTNGSEWMAAGILTGITGNRADGVIWDDLIKGREQADSDVTRNKTWDAYLDDLLTRKKPGAWEVAVTTRWHEDDPAGRILPMNYNGESGWLEGRDGNQWYVLCIPAQCERADDPLKRKIGEYIWPEWFPPGFFDSFKRNARSWSSLYQQRPAPETGEYFKAEWLVPYERHPHRDTLRIYGASDYAVTKDDGDYTVHIVVGVDPDQRIWVLDLWRGQTTSDVWVETFCDMVKDWKPIGWAEESGQIKSAVGPLIHKRLMERRLYVARADFPSRKDKQIRAQSIRGRMAQNGLYVPIAASWYADFKNELMVFDNGRNDDQVDALSLIGQVLDRMQPGEAPPKEKEPVKVFSTDPATCTVTMNDMWEANSRRNSRKTLRIA